MASKKISQLTAATTPLTGTEELAIVQGSQTVKATAQDIADLAGGGDSYTSYVALISQVGTSNPTVSVINNTLGLTLSFTRDDVGTYDASTPTSTITLNKSVFLCSSPGFTSFGPYPFTVSSVNVNSAGPNYNINLKLNAIDSSGNLLPVELSDGAIPFYLEIRQYP